MSTSTRALAIAICLTGVVAASQSVSAQPGSPTKYVRLAGGGFAGRSWKLGVAGPRHQRCFQLSLRGRVNGASDTCEADQRPGIDWRQLIGVSDLNDSATVELDLTTTRVRRLKLLLGPRSARPPTWIRVRTRRVSRGEARRAHVKRSFRFAVIHARGTLCVKKVIAFNRAGDRIEKVRVPCEL